MARPPIPSTQQQLPPPPPDQGQVFDTFSGLKNTVSPERLTSRELARAQNVDLDDLGQVHRRRGRTLKLSGSWHSMFTAEVAGRRTVLGVQNGTLVQVLPDYQTVALLGGIAASPLAWVQVGPVVYFSSIHNSGKIDLTTMAVSAWGLVRGPSYQPGLVPAPEDWWYSPVISPEPGLGPVGGKLLGAPPPGQALTWFNGRIYIAAKNVLWGTELFLYDYVDKNKNYRMFEDEITGLVAVEDGVYVGTYQALYFLAGPFQEHVRTVREYSGVVPGTMVQVPGELVDPDGRRFPDLPRPTTKAMACMTQAGMVVGLGGGQTYNLTQSQYAFPKSIKGAAMLRRQDGMNTYVAPLVAGGAPTNANARFGDYVDAVLIKAGTPGQPGTPAGPVVLPAAATQQPSVNPIHNDPGT